MDRRRLFGLGASVTLGALGFALPAHAGGWGCGCGDGDSLEEEEFIDVAAPYGNVELVAHFSTGRSDTLAERRLAVSPDGARLCFADRTTETFRVRDTKGLVSAVPAPHGGCPLFGADGRSLFLMLEEGSPYSEIVFANAGNGEHESWGDFLDSGPLVAAPGGLLVAHARQGPMPGALSWVTGREQSRELVRTSEVPRFTSVRGSRAYYWVGASCHALDLARSSPEPSLVGRLSEQPRSAMATRAGVIALAERGAWLLSSGRPRLLVEHPGLTSLVVHRDKVAFASTDRLWVQRGAAFASVAAPNANLHFVGPIMGSDAFVLCRGPSVYRYLPESARLEKIGSGRPGLKLRGAALYAGGLVTWSSRSWALGSSRTALDPPRAYLVD